MRSSEIGRERDPQTKGSTEVVAAQTWFVGLTSSTHAQILEHHSLNGETEAQANFQNADASGLPLDECRWASVKSSFIPGGG